jgi:putative hemolysin
LSPLLLYIVVLVFFLVLSAFFSAAETSFTAANRIRLKYQADAGDKKAEAINAIVSNPDRLLGAILLGVTVAEIASAGLFTYLLTTYAQWGHSEIAGLAGSIFFALVVLIFCELTPKIIAAARPEQLARNLLIPVKISILLLSPFARLAAWFANRLVRLIGMNYTASPFAHSLSEEEIRAMIANSSEEGMPEEKKEMLHNIFEIGATQVREVMIPRVEVTAIEIDDAISKILDVVNKTNYSRIPVYRQNFDNPVGILYVKDLLHYLHGSEKINLQVLLRPVHFVPDSARLDIVLRQLQSMHLHMAVVVDEYGGVEGIVTLEDLLEEIVGEIRDEHDTEIESVREISPNLFSIAGNLPVKDFNRFFDEKIPEAPEYTTVAGFVEALTGRLLLEGETVRFQSLILTIEKIEGFRIVSIRVRLSTPKPDKTATLGSQEPPLRKEKTKGTRRDAASTLKPLS